MELAMEIEGPYSQLARRLRVRDHDGDWQYQFLRSRANSIEGGTTEILKTSWPSGCSACRSLR